MNLKQLLKEIKLLKKELSCFDGLSMSEAAKECHKHKEYPIEMRAKLKAIKQTIEAIESAECDFVWKEDNALIWDEIRKELGLK